MVKRNPIILLSVFLLIAALFVFGCSNDFFGLVYSNDLDERLNHKDVMTFVNDSPALSPLGDTYNFIVVTDTHIEDGDDFGLGGIKSAVIAHNARFVVNLGDITQHGAAHDIDLFIEIADDLGVPFYPVIGNHDIYFDTWHVWRDKIGSTNYRINSGSTSLFVLDSANAFIGKRQLDWLENELKTITAPGHRVFVFTHAPLFTTGIKMQQVTDSRERARVISILRNRADIMFMGHSHQRAINRAGNVEYVTFEDFKSTKIYTVVRVTPAGVSYEFHELY
ncbi:MAG: metallophosphoesterase [Treponema sp.]|nr:metallophosphoesterase [Treponema sp.]MCL2237368.1 metallophosphoesterase [Treponema sp.]